MLSCVRANSDQDAHILVKETDPGARLKKITLRAPSDCEWFVFEPDKGRGKTCLMSPLLATGRQYDHHRACDAVIVAAREKSLQVVYIDLKSNNPEGYAGQFKSTRRFVRYALGLLEEFQGIDFGDPQERYIVFYGGRRPLIDKKPSVLKNSESEIRNSQPDRAYKREVPDGAILYLNEFLV